MPQIRLPDKLTTLFTLAEDMADGLTTHGAALNVKQNLSDAVRADLAAARTAEDNYNIARTRKTDLTRGALAEDQNAKAFLTTARDCLKPGLGTQWNSSWREAGFVDETLSLPTKPEDRMEYLKKVKTYLTANPSVEVAPLGVTAVRAQLIHDHVSDARSLLHDHVSSLGALKATRDQAAEMLRIRMRGTIAELKQLLPASDTRWFAFGLVPPGSQQSPEVPEGLILTAGAAGSGIVYLDWDDSPRAERYRVWRQLPGETEMVGLDSVTESDFTLTGQPLGQEIKIAIGAVNDTGESPRSPVSVITLT